MQKTSQRIFHIADESAWAVAQFTRVYLPPSYCGNGFIHCCTLTQLSGVLNRFFSGHDQLLLLEMESNQINESLIFENLENGTELFPHLYAPLAVVNVVRQIQLVRDQTGEFDLSNL